MKSLALDTADFFQKFMGWAGKVKEIIDLVFSLGTTWPCFAPAGDELVGVLDMALD